MMGSQLLFSTGKTWNVENYLSTILSCYNPVEKNVNFLLLWGKLDDHSFVDVFPI